MHNTFKYIILVLGLQLFCSTGYTSSQASEIVADYDLFFRQLITERNYPGAAYAIVSHDQILHIGTFGHTTAAGSQQIDMQTTFRLASVSKTIAAGVVGLLVEDGTLRWDDPVTLYVPDFSIDGDTSQISIQHLLGQTTGLMPHAYDNLLEHDKSMQSIWQKMSGLAYICEPGKCYGYQNSIFSLVDPLVKRATNMSYESLVEKRIFEPLDMNTASLGYEAFISNPNHAEPHTWRKGRWETAKVKRNYYRAAPAAGINASILDMSKWVQAQLGSKPEILSAEMVGTLFAPRIKTRREMYRKQWKSMLSDAHYGLGWRIYELGGEQLVYHGGWVSGFRADIAFSRQHDVGLVVLLNAESSGINELTTRFWQMALTL